MCSDYVYKYLVFYAEDITVNASAENEEQSTFSSRLVAECMTRHSVIVCRII